MKRALVGTDRESNEMGPVGGISLNRARNRGSGVVASLGGRSWRDEGGPAVSVGEGGCCSVEGAPQTSVVGDEGAMVVSAGGGTGSAESSPS